MLKACQCFFTIILPTHKFENVTTFLSMYFEIFAYNIFWYIINQHTISIEFEIVRNVITSCPCNFENYFALAYTIRTYHGIHDDNITWWNIPHWYKLILIHNKIKQKLSLLFTIFVAKLKIFLQTISFFSLTCTYFHTGIRCLVIFKTKYQHKHLVGTYHQNLPIILC